jgi:cell wall-associated NlpC family hydrolase
MSKFYTNIYSIVNLYKKMSSKSEVVTQMIYGDSFQIIKKNSKWLKIKIKEDGYIGFIKKIKFINFLKPTHKISVLSSDTFGAANKERKLGKLTYGSKIKVTIKNSKFSKFQNRWIENKNIKPYNYKSKNIFLDIGMFNNIKYKWGGKSFKGIDCSALVQIFFNYNNKFCPRDAKDQVKYFKNDIKLKEIKKNDVIFWKGHVAIALSKKKLIHAYGPAKKTLVMDVEKTIKLIKKTAKLKVFLVKRI